MHRIAALFAAVVMAGSASASDKISAPDTIAVMRPVRQFVGSFNRGDVFRRTYGKALRHAQIGLTISMPSATRTASLTRK